MGDQAAPTTGVSCGGWSAECRTPTAHGSQRLVDGGIAERARVWGRAPPASRTPGRLQAAAACRNRTVMRGARAAGRRTCGRRSPGRASTSPTPRASPSGRSHGFEARARSARSPGAPPRTCTRLVTATSAGKGRAPRRRRGAALGPGRTAAEPRDGRGEQHDRRRQREDRALVSDASEAESRCRRRGADVEIAWCCRYLPASAPARRRPRGAAALAGAVGAQSSAPLNPGADAELTQRLARDRARHACRASAGGERARRGDHSVIVNTDVPELGGHVPHSSMGPDEPLVPTSSVNYPREVNTVTVQHARTPTRHRSSRASCSSPAPAGAAARRARSTPALFENSSSSAWLLPDADCEGSALAGRWQRANCSGKPGVVAQDGPLQDRC